MGKKKSLTVSSKPKICARRGWEEGNGGIDETMKGDVGRGVPEWVRLHWI